MLPIYPATRHGCAWRGDALAIAMGWRVRRGGRKQVDQSAAIRSDNRSANTKGPAVKPGLRGKLCGVLARGGL